VACAARRDTTFNIRNVVLSLRAQPANSTAKVVSGRSVWLTDYAGIGIDTYAA
jgi:hypothetical protein